MRALCLILAAIGIFQACGHDGQPAARREAVGEFSVTYTDFGGLPPPPDANGVSCFERSLVTVSRSEAKKSHFCFPLEANRILYSRTLVPTEEQLAPLIDALGATALDGNVRVEPDFYLADDWAFELRAQVNSRRFSASGSRHGIGLTPDLEALLDSLDVLSAEVLKSGS